MSKINTYKTMIKFESWLNFCGSWPGNGVLGVRTDIAYRFLLQARTADYPMGLAKRRTGAARPNERDYYTLLA